jgi:hypothetical protein
MDETQAVELFFRLSMLKGHSVEIEDEISAS